jgi:hypothetical protein
MTQLEKEWTKILGWPGYRVYKHEINEKGKTLKLWVRRKAGNQKLAVGMWARGAGDPGDL